MQISSNAFLKYFSVALFVIYFFVGLIIFNDYGITTDEEFQRFSGFFWLKYVLSFTHFEELKALVENKLNLIKGFTLPNPINFPFYGVVFDLPLALIETIFNINRSENYFLLRHYFNFLIFFISSIFFFKILMNRFDNYLISIFGTLFYVGSPRIFGDSFFNNKDVIFLSLVTIALFYSLKLLSNFNGKNIILFSIFSAIATGSRVIGIFLPTSILAIIIFDMLDRKINLFSIYKVFLLIGSYFIFTIFFWPYLWEDPFTNLIKAFSIFSNYIIDIKFIFNGEFVSSKSLPYTYLPVWIFISTPTITLLLFLTGYILYAKTFFLRLIEIDKNKNNSLWVDDFEKKDFLIFLNLTIITIYLILFGAVLYNGWRQVYFINVFLIYFTSYGIFSLVKFKLFKKIKRWFFFLIGFLLVMIFYEIIKIHPYQSLYFNNTLHKDIQNKFEIDYWGLSGKRFIEEIKNLDDKKKLNIGVASWVPLERSLALFDESTKKRFNIVGQNFEKADYIFSNNITEVDTSLNNKYKIPNNFKRLSEFKLQKSIIYTIFKREK